MAVPYPKSSPKVAHVDPFERGTVFGLAMILRIDCTCKVEGLGLQEVVSMGCFRVQSLPLSLSLSLSLSPWPLPNLTGSFRAPVWETTHA